VTGQELHLVDDRSVERGSDVDDEMAAAIGLHLGLGCTHIPRFLDRQSSHGSLRRHLLTEPRRPHAVRKSPRAQWYVLATVCVGAFRGQLDASIVTLALPRLGHDLHAGVGAVEWVALSYLLVLVATVATVGRIADALGRKLLYVYGFGVFTAGSVLCGLAPTLAVLIAARVLQALGGAMLQANSVALITEAMPRPLLGGRSVCRGPRRRSGWRSARRSEGFSCRSQGGG
jgi:Major Facilitator Superfamily